MNKAEQQNITSTTLTLLSSGLKDHGISAQQKVLTVICHLIATVFMFNRHLNRYFSAFDKKRLSVDITQNDHRYNSFDFCFNYFSSFTDKAKIASDQHLETSCLQLGFYLASWGMFRGSSKLLNKSLCYFKPIIKTLSECDKYVWRIDVDKYDDRIERQRLVDAYKKIGSCIPNKTKLTLATKIMLGVFGNVPAFDRYFKLAMSKLTNSANGFTALSDKSLLTIYGFYLKNKRTIDSLAKGTKTNSFGYGNSSNRRKITKAKVIDIIGFQYGLQLPT